MVRATGQHENIQACEEIEIVEVQDIDLHEIFTEIAMHVVFTGWKYEMNENAMIEQQMDAENSIPKSIGDKKENNQAKDDTQDVTSQTQATTSEQRTPYKSDPTSAPISASNLIHNWGAIDHPDDLYMRSPDSLAEQAGRPTPAQTASSFQPQNPSLSNPESHEIRLQRLQYLARKQDQINSTDHRITKKDVIDEPTNIPKTTSNTPIQFKSSEAIDTQNTSQSDVQSSSSNTLPPKLDKGKEKVPYVPLQEFTPETIPGTIPVSNQQQQANTSAGPENLYIKLYMNPKTGRLYVPKGALPAIVITVDNVPYIVDQNLDIPSIVKESNRISSIHARHRIRNAEPPIIRPPERLNPVEPAEVNPAFVDNVASMLRIFWLVFRVSLVVVIFGSNGSPERRAAVRLAGTIFILYRLGWIHRIAGMFGWNLRNRVQRPAPGVAAPANANVNANIGTPIPADGTNVATDAPPPESSRVVSILRVVALFVCTLVPGLEQIVQIE